MTQPAIAEALGRSKGAIFTKLRDLGLNAPASAQGQPRKNHTRVRAGKVTLPPLASLSDC